MAKTWTAMATILYCAYTCYSMLWYTMVPLKSSQYRYSYTAYTHSLSIRCILFMYMYVCMLNAWSLYDPNPVPNNINKKIIHACRMVLPTEDYEKLIALGPCLSNLLNHRSEATKGNPLTSNLLTPRCLEHLEHTVPVGRPSPGQAAIWKSKYQATMSDDSMVCNVQYEI